MLNHAHKIIYPVADFLMNIERLAKVSLYNIKKKNRVISNFAGKHITLGRMVMYALAAVAIFYSLGIRVPDETLAFMKGDLFFKPLSFIIPVLIGTAMFAVPQRIPLETLANIGTSVIVTYLLTTMVSSSMGYGSVVLFDTAQYLKPLLSKDITGTAKAFSTDFTLLYIIAIALVSSVIVTYAVKGHNSLQKQVVFLSLFLEKIAYIALATILWLMPLAVFASILGSIQTHGLDKLTSLGWFVLYVNIPQAIYLLMVIYALKLATKTSFAFSFNGIKALAKIAVPSGSSAATILTNVETARTFPILEKYKNKGFIASILPFGATVNMNGTALFITIMCKIGADIQGINVTYWDIIPYAVAYSCAAAAVPSASIVLITAIYTVLGIDPAITLQILGLMIAVDWINDRSRTLINVSGDLFSILLSLNEKSPLQLFVKLFRRKSA